MRVTIGRTGRDAGGMKTDSPSIADCLRSVMSSQGPADLTQRREVAARHIRNQRHGTTDFTDFTDKKFLVSAFRICCPSFPSVKAVKSVVKSSRK